MKLIMLKIVVMDNSHTRLTLDLGKKYKISYHI